MKYARQFAIILVISFAGEILNKVIPLPVPASIYGLIIMFAALRTGVVQLASVKKTAYFLIEIMPVMFIPAAVGLLETWGTLRQLWLPFCVITLLSTIAVMAVAGHVTQEVLGGAGSNAEEEIPHE